MLKNFNEKENEVKEVHLLCEICGKEAKLREDLGWIEVLCEEHYKEFLDKNAYLLTYGGQDI